MYDPHPQRHYPPAWRITLAFVVAPAFASVMMALIAPAFAGLPSWAERVIETAKTYALLGAYPTTLFVGVPAYFMLRRHFAALPINCVAAGALVAALPWLALISIVGPAGSASIDGRATVVDGHFTGFGWLVLAWFIGQIAIVGAVAGGLFWAIAAAGDKKIERDDSS